jgi:asparagine synthase (glutamine-hydrolysing)
LEVLDAYLCFTYVPGQQTFFDAIYKLRPAHSITVKNGSVSESAYWDLEILDEPEARTDELQICEEFTALFENAVAIRMRSDVPFGAFLSGGLDSSCVVRVMSEFSSMPVRTCTIGFENEDFDERALARLVAHRYGTEHVETVSACFGRGPCVFEVAVSL